MGCSEGYRLARSDHSKDKYICSYSKACGRATIGVFLTEHPTFLGPGIATSNKARMAPNSYHKRQNHARQLDGEEDNIPD